MDEFKVILVMNESMIKLLKDKNVNHEINLKIREYLKDEAIFFKIDRLSAYKILENIGVRSDQVENVYKKLISKKMFCDLLSKKKISLNDEKLIIKYNLSDYNNLFKK